MRSCSSSLFVQPFFAAVAASCHVLYIVFVDLLVFIRTSEWSNRESYLLFKVAIVYREWNTVTSWHLNLLRLDFYSCTIISRIGNQSSLGVDHVGRISLESRDHEYYVASRGLNMTHQVQPRFTPSRSSFKVQCLFESAYQIVCNERCGVILHMSAEAHQSGWRLQKSARKRKQ